MKRRRPPGFFNYLCDLEAEGRADEARALLTRSERAELARAWKVIAEAWSRRPPGTDDLLEKLRVAKANPDNPNARPWLAMRTLMLWEVVEIAPHLPDPRVRFGRPKGSGPVAVLLREMDSLVSGRRMQRTAGAKMLWPKDPRYLVRLYGKVYGRLERGKKVP